MMVKSNRWLWLIAVAMFFIPLSLEAAEIGEPMPSFKLTTLDGEVIDSTALIGEKPIFMVFWATWCPNCKREIPHINKMAEEFGPKGMVFLGVNVGVNDSEKKVRRYAEKYKMHYPLYFDEGSLLTRKFKVSGTPTVIIVDKNGIVRYRDVSPPADLLIHFDALNN
ncbi:MAG: TlpA disulfide reductase family protein [Thermodesulfobacteriota bacterium]